MQSKSRHGQPYSSPQLRTRTFAQATVFLTGYAWIGDEGARDLLESLFPVRESHGVDSATREGLAPCVDAEK